MTDLPMITYEDLDEMEYGKIIAKLPFIYPTKLTFRNSSCCSKLFANSGYV